MRFKVLMLISATLVGAPPVHSGKPGYLVWVDRVTVRVKRGDAFSRADVQVEIRRRAPAIQERVDALSDRISAWKAETRKLRPLMSRLQEKRKLSELRPGPELTPAERQRLDRLSRTPLEDAARTDIRAFRALKAKEKRSRRQPGPPLTVAEAAKLKKLKEQIETNKKSRLAADKQRDALLAMIVGRTPVVTTDAKTVFFGSRPVLTIYEGDLLQVRVLEKDFLDDDVFGSHVVHATSDLLVAGSVDLGRTAGISALILKFRPTGR